MAINPLATDRKFFQDAMWNYSAFAIMALTGVTLNFFIACNISSCPFLFSRRAKVNIIGAPLITNLESFVKLRKSTAPGYTTFTLL